MDLAPTVAELAGLPAAPEWQGRSLFDAVRVPRAYFYVAEDQFTPATTTTTLPLGERACALSYGRRSFF